MAKRVLGGVGAVLFGLFIFYLTNPRFFAERGVHFDGGIRRLRPVGDGKLLVVEHVEAGGGEDGPISVGDRWRILDVATGNPVAGPFFVDRTQWIELVQGRVLVRTLHGFEVRGLDNALLATLAAFPAPSPLRADDVELDADGRVSAMSEDGRFYLLDPVTLKAEAVAQRPPRFSSPDPKPEVSVRGLELKGQPRASVNGKGPDYLDPDWLGDPLTRAPIAAAGGFLMLHHQRVYSAKGGRGPMLSAVTADGTEQWKYVLPFEHLYGIAVFGDRLVVGVNEHDEGGPGWLRVVSLTDGKELWKVAL